MQDSETTAFLDLTGAWSINSGRWSENFVNSFNERYMLNTLLSMKYILSMNPQMDIAGYTLEGSHGDIYVYENEYFLPLGTAFDKYVFRSELDGLDNVLKDAVLLNAVVLEDGSPQPPGMSHFDIAPLSSAVSATDLIPWPVCRGCLIRRFRLLGAMA